VVLWKQIHGEKSGSNLALSDHLRDAGHTEFLHLYDWLDAAVIDPKRYGNIPGLDKEARVRMAQRLFDNHFWHKVNEVHANGQGDVNMAFIRDQLGNWNLKAFDQDTMQLVDAYREMTTAGLKLATEVATAIGTGGAAKAPQLALAVAGQLIEGRVGGEALVASNAQLEALRNRVAQDLENAKAAIAASPSPGEVVALAAKAEEADSSLKAANQELTAAKDALSAKENELGPNKAELERLTDLRHHNLRTVDFSGAYSARKRP
jgi:hypothetical protein